MSEPQNETRTSAQLARPNNARIVSSIIESTPFYRGLPYEPAAVERVWSVCPTPPRGTLEGRASASGGHRPSGPSLPYAGHAHPHGVPGTGRNKNLIRANVCMEPDGVTWFQTRGNSE